MSPVRYPTEIVVGRGPDRVGYRVRPRELLVAFREDADDGEIERALDERGLNEHRPADFDPAAPPWQVEEHGSVEKRSRGAEHEEPTGSSRTTGLLRSQGMRWVEAPSSGSTRTIARDLLENVRGCWLASPVAAPRSNPVDGRAAAPLPGDLTVSLEPGAKPDVVGARLERLGFAEVEDMGEVSDSMLQFRIEDGIQDDGFDRIDRVAAVRGVMMVEFDWLDLVPVAFEPAKSLWPDQWSLWKIEMPDAWDASRGDAAVTIAVIDTGFDLSAGSELEHAWTAGPHMCFGPDCGPGGADIPLVADLADLPSNQTQWHGTAVAGVIGSYVGPTPRGAAAVEEGVAGVAPGCSILPIRLQPITSAGVAKALLYAKAMGAKVANLSLTAPPQYGLEAAANSAWDNGHGMLICAAAGNVEPGQSGGVRFPARFRGVVAVGASDEDDDPKRLGTPNEEGWAGGYGSSLDVTAPGIRILTADASGDAGYNRGDNSGGVWAVMWYGVPYRNIKVGDAGGANFLVFTGTSAATPHVSGLGALLFSNGGAGTTARQVRDAIEATCAKVGAGYTLATARGSWSARMGYGRIQAAAALQRLA